MPAAPFRSVAIPALSTAGTSQPYDRTQFSLLSFFFESAGTTSGGTLLIEEADWDPLTEPDYTGTWSLIATVLASSFTGGAQIAYHLSPNNYGFTRVRISSAITGGGTVEVVARGMQ